MKNLFTLRIVNISYNWITCEVADNIAAVLSQNTHLRKVYLAKNDLAANGIITLCRGMSNILYLTHLDMSCNKITDEAAHDIATFLYHNPELKVLDFSNNLMQIPGATTVYKAISTLTNLRKLDISYNNITDHDEIAFDTAIAFKLANTKPSEKLSLLKSCSVKRIFLTMKNIFKLDLGSTEMIDLAACNIAALLIKMNKLDLSYNNILVANLSKVFIKLNISHMTKINISNNAMDEQAADDIGIFLSKNTELKELDISCNNLYESGTKVLCERIKNLTKLTKLKVGGNDFTHLAANDVAEVFTL